MAALQVRRLQGGQPLSAPRALAGLALLSAWLAPSSAAAHGLAPRALAPLLQDDRGVGLVRLTRGLARRSDSGFSYFCPSHWDGYESAPVTSLPAPTESAPAARSSTGAVLALPSGLVVLGADGSSTPYPEPDLGSIVALASSQSAAYALAVREARYELRRLAPAQSQLVWSAPESEGDWLALGAGERSLLLLGLDGGRLTQLELGTSGDELSRGHADVGVDTLSVEAVIAGDTSYALVRSESGDRLELGRIVADRWLALVQAVGNLSGPVETGDGKRLLARDGALVSLDGEPLGAPSDSEFVAAVASVDGKVYASVRDGLRVLTGAQLGALVFDFATLHGPETGGLSPPEKTTCENAWQHLQVDLVAAGLIGVETALDAGVTSSVDAGAVPPVSDASTFASAAANDAAARPSTRPDAATPAPPAAAHRADGCALASGAPRGGAAGTLTGLVLLCRRWRRRRPGPWDAESRAR